MNGSEISKFIGLERDRYAGIDDNRFAFSLAQPARYLGFIETIMGRYAESSYEFMTSIRSLQSSVSKGSRELTANDIKQLEANAKLAQLVHLEIESFYLFAKILLNKLALFVQDYFGKVQGCPLTSHDGLSKKIHQYVQDTELRLPDGFIERCVWLKEHISDFRDKQISHLKNPRSMYVTMFNLNNPNARIGITNLYPNDRELQRSQIESEELPILLIELYAYIDQICELVTTNRSRSRYSLKD